MGRWTALEGGPHRCPGWGSEPIPRRWPPLSTPTGMGQDPSWPRKEVASPPRGSLCPQDLAGLVLGPPPCPPVCAIGEPGEK